MKKQSFITILVTVLISMVGAKAFAYDIAVENADGVTIYYNYSSDGTNLIVTRGGYRGSIVIPEEVTFMNRTRKVISISDQAFYNSGLTTITIPNSVESIGDEAFKDCNSLTSITIPNSVKSIGKGVFQNCTSLTSVTIPNGLYSISENLFYGCSALKSVTIPYVTEIKRYAFKDCTSLSSVIIPYSVTTIREGAFENCPNLTSITIPNSVTSIETHAFLRCSGLTSITIPNSVTSLGHDAFDGVNLQSVISLIENPFEIYTPFNKNTLYNATLYVPIGTIAKYKATKGWKDFIFIEENAEAGECSCGDNANYSFDKVTHTLTISGRGDMDNFAQEKAPWYSYAEDIHIVKIEPGITSIGDWSFYDCTKITSVSIPNGVTYIGESTFRRCLSLISVNIPNSVTYIGENAFGACGFSSLNIPNSVTSIGKVAFVLTNLTSISIPSSVTKIEYGTFMNCSKLTSITIPNSVTTIDDHAFYGCKGLTSITIPNSVTTISNSTFEKCNSLASITIPNTITSIGDFAFKDCNSLTSITIPNGVMNIGYGAFSACSNLISITLGNSVTSIESSAFNGANIQSVISLIENPFEITGVSSELFRTFSINTFNNATLYVPVGTKNKYMATEGWKDFLHIEERDPSAYDIAVGNDDGITIYYRIFNDNAIVTYEYDEGGDYYSHYSGNVVIPESVEYGGKIYNVTGIDGYAFNYCQDLTSITISNGVTRIGLYAFESCRNLTSITIPSSLNYIDEDAFRFCDNLTSVYLSDISAWCNIHFVGGEGYTNPFCYANHLFLNGKEVKDLVIPDDVTSIGKSVFSDCTGLTSVTIPNSVTSIGGYAFSGCSGLTSIIIPNSVTEIGRSAFIGCTGLRKVVSLIENPIEVDVEYGFSSSTFQDATLYVPVGTIDLYKSANGWKDFAHIVEGTDPDSGTGISGTKMKVGSIIIQTNGNQLTISGVDAGTAIHVFDIVGRAAGSAIASTEPTTINTSLHIGDIGIVKIGDKTVKVLMK